MLHQLIWRNGAIGSKKLVTRKARDPRCFLWLCSEWYIVVYGNTRFFFFKRCSSCLTSWKMVIFKEQMTKNPKLSSQNPTDFCFFHTENRFVTDKQISSVHPMECPFWRQGPLMAFSGTVPLGLVLPEFQVLAGRLGFESPRENGGFWLGLLGNSPTRMPKKIIIGYI